MIGASGGFAEEEWTTREGSGGLSSLKARHCRAALPPMICIAPV